MIDLKRLNEKASEEYLMLQQDEKSYISVGHATHYRDLPVRLSLHLILTVDLQGPVQGY